MPAVADKIESEEQKVSQSSKEKDRTTPCYEVALRRGVKISDDVEEKQRI